MIAFVRSVFFGPNPYAAFPCAVISVNEASSNALHEARAKERLRELERVLGAAGLGGVRGLQGLASGAEGALSVERFFPALLTDYWAASACVPYRNAVVGPGPLDEVGSLHFAWAYDDSFLAEHAAQLACAAANYVFNGSLEGARDGGEVSFSTLAKLGLEELKARGSARAISSTQQAIIQAAREREIPVVRWADWPFVEKERGLPLDRNAGVYQLGQGVHHVVLYESCPLSGPERRMPLAMDREVQYRVLFEAGVPVPIRDTEFANVNSGGRAVRSAERIGFPVALKSREGLPFASVVTNLLTPDDVAAAYKVLGPRSRQVLVERHCSGSIYRLFVVDRSVIAATIRRPFVLVGDGRSSVLQLIDGAIPVDASDVRRDIASEALRVRLRSALSLRGIHGNHVPSAGYALLIQSGAEPTVAGCNSSASAEISSCPRIEELALASLGYLGLRVGAVEIAVDVALGKLDSESAVVVAVDPIPDLAFHCIPGEVLPKTVASIYLDALALEGPARVPIAAITGTNGKTTTCRMIDHILRCAGTSTGLACTDGFYLNGARQRKGVYSGISGALQVFAGANVEAAVLETSRGTLLSRGLASQYCNVAACTNVAEDHLGEDGIDTLGQLAYLKGVVIRAARDCVVVNGDDALCVDMVRGAPHVPRTIYVHLDQGKAVRGNGLSAEVLLYDRSSDVGRIVWRRGDVDLPVVDVDRIPATWCGGAIHNVENAMFATAVALGLGVSLETIREGLEGFDTSIARTPGRLNVFDRLPFRIVIDYAHNAHGFKVLCQFTRSLKPAGKRTLIVFCQERQRPVDRQQIAKVVSGHFDRFICRDPLKVERSEVGVIAGQMRDALVEVGVFADAISVVPILSDAVEQALGECEPGDLLVIGASSRYDKVWKQLEAYEVQKAGADPARNRG